jgi:flagellar motor switch protein FliG/cbb3-type cytochrome oxidase subunit 3
MKLHWKRNLKIAAFLLLAVTLVQATMILSFAQDTAGLRAESSTLENMYQEKVHNILDNLMTPEDYTLVISATLKNDEGKLKEYNDAVDKKFLPGLPINDPMGYSDTQNILLDLKQKVDIQVILSDSVPADRDTIVKDILKTKLHLNEETGDTITVVRALRNTESPAQMASPKLPELSAKMIAFWIIVCMMVLTGIIFWMQRRKEKKKEAEHAEQAIKIEQAQAKQVEDDTEAAKEVVEVPLIKELTEEEKVVLDVKTGHFRNELMKLAREYMQIVALAGEEFVSQGRVNEAIIFMESIGWDESKKIFNDSGSRFWTKVGAALRDRKEEPGIMDIYNAVEGFHRFALSFVLERTAKEGENPFSFIFQLTDDQRLDLLNSERAENIALIGVYCNGSQMGELLQGLASKKQNDVLLNLTQIKQLPEAEIRKSADALLIRLDRIKEDPSVYADGPMLAADFLRSLPAAREEELVQYLLVDHPREGEKLRKVRVMFQDVPTYPLEIVKKVIENFESEDIQRALVGYDANFVETFLSLLPTKKALMIQNDLFHMTEYPPISQCAESRRKICQKIETEFELQRFSLEEHWKNTSFDPGMMETTSQEVTEEITEIFSEEVGEEVREQTYPEIESEKTQELLRALPIAVKEEVMGPPEKPFDLVPGDDEEKYKAA